MNVSPKAPLSVNGVLYPNLLTALVSLDLMEYRSATLVAEAKRNNVTLTELIEYYVSIKDMDVKVSFNKRGRLTNALTNIALFNTMFNLDLKSESEMFAHIKLYLNSTFITLHYLGFDAVMVIKYLVDAGLEPLLSKRKIDGIFEFRGVFYHNATDFFVSHNMYSVVFYAELFRQKGDFDKAIELAQSIMLGAEKGDYFYDKHFTSVQELMGLVNRRWLTPIRRVMAHGVTIGVAAEIHVALMDFKPQLAEEELPKRHLNNSSTLQVTHILVQAYKEGKTVRSVDDLRKLLREKGGV